MTAIQMTLLQQGLDPAIATDASVSWVPTKAVGTAAGLLLPAPKAQSVANGAATFYIEPCDGTEGWCWVVTVTVDGAVVMRAGVLVPDVEGVLVYPEGMTEVDPATLATTGPTSAWIAATDAAIAARDAAIAARDAAAASAASIAPGVLVATPIKSNTAVAIGDSNTANYGGTPGGDMWFNHACLASGQRLRNIGSFATGGMTLEQIRDTHVPSVLALDAIVPVGVCFVLNSNMGDLGTQTAIAAKYQTLLQIKTTLRAHGIQLVVLNVPPREDGYQIPTQAWNAFLAVQAARDGLMVVDTHTPLANLAGGWASAALHADAIHLSRTGQRILGEAVAESGVVDLLPQMVAPVAYSTNDPSDLLGGYGLFTAGTQGGPWAQVVPAGWDHVGGIPNAKYEVAPRGSTLALAGGSDTSVLYRETRTGFTPGDKVMLAGRIKSQGYEAGYIAAGSGTKPSFSVAIGRIDDSGSGETGNSVYAIDHWSTDVDGVFYLEIPTVATTVGLQVLITLEAAQAGCEVRLSQIVLRNLTGLAVQG